MKRMNKMTLLLLCSSSLLSAASSYAAEVAQAPGSANRPILSQQEAAVFTPENFFARGGVIGNTDNHQWVPDAAIDLSQQTPWVVGKDAAYQTVQQAINAALTAPRADSDARIFIKILPGSYQGSVYIPADAPPITLLGAGQDPKQVVLSLALDSMISPEVWRNTVNDKGQYQPGDPAWDMYQTCATTPEEMVTTLCSAVVWVQNDGFQLANLTVENSLLDTVDGGAHQGVALRTDGDKVQIEDARLIGRQDTFFVNTSDKHNRYVTDRISRALIKNSYIEGDVDYVFGRATAVFDNVHFHTVSTRAPKNSYVLAPNTLFDNPYGFLVINSRFTTDQGYGKDKYAQLGRSWDQGARATGYLPGKTSNGQVLIASSTFDSGYDPQALWGSAATTKRPFKGNNAADRDLNDIQFNRLWEYANVQKD